jgi:hypothetical protein
MSTLHVLRLAQYWDWRIKPLLTPEARSRPLYSGELSEAIGWLIEGVFCGYFKTNDADVAWVRIQQATDGHLDDGLAPAGLLAQIRGLQRTANPFNETHQMPDGPQRDFELPLFGHALLLADRFAADVSAYRCSVSLAVSDAAFQEMTQSWNSIDAAEVVADLCALEGNIGPSASLLAGFIRLLEHMEAGRRFMAHAGKIGKGSYGVNFDDYTERIASLNGWRVPLMRDSGQRRFENLEALLRLGLRADPDGAKSLEEGLDEGLSQYVSALKTSWEAAQLSGFRTTH